MMNRYYDSHFDRQIVTIYPCEFFSTTGDELISTVLGSCISVTLFDERNGFGGMNHFMYANTLHNIDDEPDMRGRYGEYAVKLLLEDMMKKGADRSALKAKIFGGSNVFNLPPDAGIQVGDMNIHFAFDYLKKENIPVIASDTGGIFPRKIYFDPKTSKVWLKRIKTQNATDVNALLQKEKTYILSAKH
jgi:chemotaxis protein CheD